MLKETKYEGREHRKRYCYKGEERSYISSYIQKGKCICECGNDEFKVTNVIIDMSRHSSAPSDFQAELKCTKCKKTDTLYHEH